MAQETPAPERLGPMFADLALRLLDSGFNPIPLEGKKPLVRGWQRPHSADDVEVCVTKYPIANVGVQTWDLCVIDIDADDPEEAFELRQAVQSTLGSTDFIRIGRYPRVALFFRTDNPVRSKKVGPVEILGTGRQVVVHGTHPVTQRPYYWVDDSIADAGREQLPMVTAKSVAAFLALLQAKFPPSDTKRGDRALTDLSGTSLDCLDNIPSNQPFALDGQRNDAFFTSLRAEAFNHEGVETFLEAALVPGRQCVPPLSLSQIRQSVRSVWNYKLNGTLIPPRQPAVLLPIGPKQAISLAQANPYASALYMVLRVTRPRQDAFTIPIKETARRLSWSPNTVQKAIKSLLNLSLLNRVGRAKGQPGRRAAILYTFAIPAMR